MSFSTVYQPRQWTSSTVAIPETESSSLSYHFINVHPFGNLSIQKSLPSLSWLCINFHNLSTKRHQYSSDIRSKSFYQNPICSLTCFPLPSCIIPKFLSYIKPVSLFWQKALCLHFLIGVMIMEIVVYLRVNGDLFLEDKNWLTAQTSLPLTWLRRQMDKFKVNTLCFIHIELYKRSGQNDKGSCLTCKVNGLVNGPINVLPNWASPFCAQIFIYTKCWQDNITYSTYKTRWLVHDEIMYVNIGPNNRLGVLQNWYVHTCNLYKIKINT